MDPDVVIVGSGPAGVSAALALGGRRRVMVIERLSPERFSRYHSICGEAVSDRMFREIGIEPEGVVARVDTLEISYPGGVTVKVPVAGSIIDRPEMLKALRDRCDAEFVSATVRGVRREACGFLLDTTVGEIHCRYLIGADGAHSVVRRDIFGTVPEMLPVVNNIAEGDGGTCLAFSVGQGYGGFYRWRFPSKPGTVSIGTPKGAERPEGTISTGARHLPYGGVPEVVSGNAMLVGDAAALANPLCYGGIGIAMLSGKMAAEAVAASDPGAYARWRRRSVYTDPHFMRAHRQFSEWTDEDITRAMAPLGKKYSIPRGFLAILRHPGYANVYFATWMSLRRGW